MLTGPVRGWEGPSLTSLGEIIYMGSVAVGLQHHDRYFVLFPTTLVILSVSHRLSAFIYEVSDKAIFILRIKIIGHKSKYLDKNLRVL